MTKKTIVAVLLAICLLSGLVACGAKTFELENITMIELTDGSSGETVKVTEVIQIQTIIQSFVDNDFKKEKSSSDSTGWSYRLKFYQDEKIKVDISVMDESRISYDGYFYDIKDGTIDITYLNNILNYKEGLIYSEGGVFQSLDVDRINIAYEVTKDEKNEVDITETETILKIISLCEPAKLENTSKPMRFPRFNISFYYNGEIVADFHVDNNEVISGNRLGVGNHMLPDNSVFIDLQEIFNNSK